MPGPLCILWTSSRGLTAEHRAPVEAALKWALGEFVSVGLPELWHGDAHGGDHLAADVWEELRRSRPGWLGQVRAFPASSYGGPLRRNRYMVELAPTCCVAFALDWASGTGHCARRARRAGIPTRDFGVDTRTEARPRGGYHDSGRR